MRPAWQVLIRDSGLNLNVIAPANIKAGQKLPIVAVGPPFRYLVAHH